MTADNPPTRKDGSMADFDVNFHPEISTAYTSAGGLSYVM